MDSLDHLNMRIERVISELKDITPQFLERDIADSKKAVSFGQVKEIEASNRVTGRQRFSWFLNGIKRIENKSYFL